MKSTKTQKYQEWKKILKDDEDFDWMYIIRILKYKLERTRNCIVTNNLLANVATVEKQIITVEKLLDRIEKDNYLEEELKILEGRYGKRNLKMKTKPSSRKNCSEVILISNWDKLPSSKRGAAKRSLKAAYTRASKKQMIDLQKAFNLMAKNMMNWWD